MVVDDDGWAAFVDHVFGRNGLGGRIKVLCGVVRSGMSTQGLSVLRIGLSSPLAATGLSRFHFAFK